jgi:hypothetical protein
MNPYGRLLAPILVVALAGCGSGGAAIPTAAKTTDQPMSADARPTPAPAASGTLAYILDGDVYVADPDGSDKVKIAKGISFLRTLPARATSADLWAGVEALTVEGDGRERLAAKHGTVIDSNAHRRFAAFIRQAQQYYAAVGPLDWSAPREWLHLI